jgi:Asp-tRNA(Asn)/Glu-tRNA(Gln) amidotransferase A subunit family amidase
MKGIRGAAPLLPTSYYLQAQRVRRWLRDLIDEAIAPFDAVMMATAPGAAPRDLTGSGDPSLLLPWSHMGQPTINIPGGLDRAGLPLGLQLASPSMTDEQLMAVGAWCEDVLGLLPVPEIV